MVIRFVLGYATSSGKMRVVHYLLLGFFPLDSSCHIISIFMCKALIFAEVKSPIIVCPSSTRYHILHLAIE
jgi:hypothetical protein